MLLILFQLNEKTNIKTKYCSICFVTTALRKVDLFAVNDEGITSLHDAARKNHVEACRLLLQHGGNKLLRALNIWKQTPLDIA
ncbi:hypothetical protein DPMN_045395 [Dreissena polymorpha]|uniref:ANK_REP_REGION domain-containing protein n=1 Tax=Dreissena polymorpha TaxID=45954 RepID=A0A9D4D4T4_DREPO|nr:hypothetical protein DPMN_045395 [Dreissena polymorpha]